MSLGDDGSRGDGRSVAGVVQAKVITKWRWVRQCLSRRDSSRLQLVVVSISERGALEGFASS
ncbi:hypothetical protein IG631_18567 [Alternaria alternata]|nr:hypothetical protein IG631_18567 [Alternaria alternata]